jgi:hypothetical protein
VTTLNSSEDVLGEPDGAINRRFWKTKFPAHAMGDPIGELLNAIGWHFFQLVA